MVSIKASLAYGLGSSPNLVKFLIKSITAKACFAKAP